MHRRILKVGRIAVFSEDALDPPANVGMGRFPMRPIDSYVAAYMFQPANF